MKNTDYYLVKPERRTNILSLIPAEGIYIKNGCLYNNVHFPRAYANAVKQNAKVVSENDNNNEAIQNYNFEQKQDINQIVGGLIPNHQELEFDQIKTIYTNAKNKQQVEKQDEEDLYKEWAMREDYLNIRRSKGRCST